MTGYSSIGRSKVRVADNLPGITAFRPTNAQVLFIDDAPILLTRAAKLGSLQNPIVARMGPHGPGKRSRDALAATHEKLTALGEGNGMRDILKILERAGLPFVTVTYAVTVAIQFRDALDKLGWRVVSITILLGCVAWLVYTFTAKRSNAIDPSYFQSAYGWGTRLGAIAAVLAALIPAGYAILPSGPRVPFILFKAINDSSRLG